EMMMKSFLYIINKNSDNLIESKKVIQMIDILKNCSHKHFEYTKRNIQCFAYTNEPNVDPRQAISNDQHFFTATAGQLGITDQKFQEDIMRFGSNTANKYIKNLSGGHAVSFAHFESNTVRVYNHFSRVNPVYLLE